MSEKCCYNCGKKALSKNEIGLTKKLLDIKTIHFLCLDCLAEYLEIETEFLIAKVQEFKDQGCLLF